MTELERALIEYNGDNSKPFCDLVYKALRTQQKVDEGKLVEVVRCGDCKHNMFGETDGFITCDADDNCYHATDFCSHGCREEKK